jgi:diaminopimelate epimerase
MESVIRFVKMHGLSNDFVVVDSAFEPRPEIIRSLCDRRRGIGADGVLSVGLGGSDAAITMGYWNADGTTAEMCGNGLRCVARYAVNRQLVTEPTFTVSTPAGVKQVRINPEVFELRNHSWTAVDVGNPHVVAQVPDPTAVDVKTEGPAIEHDPRFTNGTNVEFVAIDGARIDMRVWERGVGETQACGSGIVAAAAAARVSSPDTDTWTVTVPGGTATVTFEADHVWLEGPAVTVFEGSWSQ